MVYLTVHFQCIVCIFFADSSAHSISVLHLRVVISSSAVDIVGFTHVCIVDAPTHIVVVSNSVNTPTCPAPQKI